MLEEKINIIEENDNYLVINKPAGLIVHGGKSIKEKTLVDYLLEKYPELKNVGEDTWRPGIVHRLDKEASGLMLVSKNNQAFEYFKQLFKERKIEKRYLALVSGKVFKDEGIIDFPIKRSSQGHKMAAVPLIKKEIDTEAEEMSNRRRGHLKALESSRLALTEFKVLQRLINYTLVEVKIETGRTHQIRVHFSAYGNPLIGDRLYGDKKSKLRSQKLKIDRIFLMASYLRFKDQDGEEREYSLELSPDLQEILTKAK